jgi:hypothetical protein
MCEGADMHSFLMVYNPVILMFLQLKTRYADACYLLNLMAE